MEALKDYLDIPVAENAWTTRPDSADYAVIAYDYENNADDGENQKQERSHTGSIDLFSKNKRGNDYPAEIEEILTDCCENAWELNSFTWEEDTGLFHWEWIFEVEE